MAVRNIGRDEGQARNTNGPQATPSGHFQICSKWLEDQKSLMIHRQHLRVIFKFIQNVWSTKEFFMTHLRDKSSGSGFLGSQLPIKQEHLVGHRTPHNPEQRETVTQEQCSCLILLNLLKPWKGSGRAGFRRESEGGEGDVEGGGGGGEHHVHQAKHCAAWRFLLKHFVGKIA